MKRKALPFLLLISTALILNSCATEARLVKDGLTETTKKQTFGDNSNTNRGFFIVDESLYHKIMNNLMDSILNDNSITNDIKDQQISELNKMSYIKGGYFVYQLFSMNYPIIVNMNDCKIILNNSNGDSDIENLYRISIKNTGKLESYIKQWFIKVKTPVISGNYKGMVTASFIWPNGEQEDYGITPQ